MTAPASEAPRHPLQTFALVLAILIGVVFVMVQWRDILIPIVIAVVVWYIILALSQAFSRIPLAGRRLPRWACQTASVASVFAAGFGFIELMRTSIRALQEAAPRYGQQLDVVIQRLADLAGLEHAPTFTQIRSDIDLEAVAGYFLSSATSILFDGILIFFYVLFLMIQSVYFPKKLAIIVKDETRRQAIQDMVLRIHRDVQVYIGVMAFLAVVTGAVTYLVLSLVGVDFAILWSVVIALFSFIPTIGTIFGIAFPAAVALLQFETLTPFVIVLTTLGAAQLLLNNLAQPALMGRSLNLSPFIILVALAVWGTIWGIVGAVLCVPITVAATIVLSHFAATRPVAVILSLDGELR